MTANAQVLPLTPLQQGMLSHWLQHPRSGADIEQMVCTLPESVDASRLRAAWERALQRHDALRLVFDWTGESPCQRVAHQADLPWQEKSIQADELPAFLHEDRFAGFNPGEPPLMRLTLLKLSETNWRLVWTFHHLLLDGRSITRVLQEVFADYDGSVAAPQSSAPLQPWLDWQASVDHDASLGFWKDHLKGVHGAPAPVIDHLGTLTELSRQAEADHWLTEEQTSNLNGLAQSAGVTLNTLIQGAWALLISRYTGEESIVFGATRACRYIDYPDAESLCGLLINTVPVHTTVSGDQPLTPWLQSLRHAWIAMRPHELTPLPLIRRAAGLPGDQPLFNHLVVFENEDFTGALQKQHPEWQHRRFELRELTTVPLTLQAYGGPALRLHCAFDTAKFDAAFITRMLGHAAHLLRQFCDAPEATLDRFTIATPEEAAGLIAHGNRGATEVASEATLHGWFRETAARFPGHIAVSGTHGSWSYVELDERSNAIAATLTDSGVRQGDIVALLMDRTGSIAAGILGILKAGAAYLPIDPVYPAERAAFMVADSGVRVLLTDTAMQDRVPPGDFRTVNCDSLPATAPPPALAEHSPDDTAYIIFTSGSTGKPKGCMISHRNVVRLMRATEPWFQFNEHDVWTLFHSSAFDFSVWEIWGSLLYGGRLAVVPWLTTRSPDDFCRLLCQEGVTVLNQTPSAFRQLIAAEPLARSADPSLPPFSLRTVIFGGEALEMHSLRPWFERHGDQKPQLVNMYGITETTVHVTYRPVSASDLTGGSVIGEPIPDLQLYVLDPHTRQPAPVGIPGEMYVGGAGLAKGYLNRPELTAERFPASWLPAPAHGTPDTGPRRLYKTGDLARVVPSANGYDLEFLGRIDDQVKIRGFRIELGEIESVLCSHPQVSEACVMVKEDRPGDRRLCAWMVAPQKPDSTALREHLKSRLPDYMVPAAFVCMDAFPLTTNGKLDRRALPAPVVDAAARKFTAPSSAAEQTLADIWSRVLRVSRVGIHDNFFELGGDSILSIQVIARAREAGLTLTPRQLFENPTIAALAALAMDKPTTAQSSAPAEVSGPFQPSPIQQWFLEQELEGGNHWNQTFLFSVSERLDTTALSAALRAVIAHHSALRLRFIRRNNTWEATVHPEPDDDILSLHNLSEYQSARLVKQIERACRVEQARLSFEFGPLLRAAYIDCGEDRPGRLLITVHHLAVDGVSWHILLADIERAYRQCSQSRSVLLPPATAPFSAWADHVRKWADSPPAQAEAAFWRDTIERSRNAADLHEDGDGYGSNTESGSYTIRTRLTKEETDALIQKVPAAWRTRINDALLTALVQAVKAQTGNSSLSLHMEGHGREAHIGGDLDVSRTVGWFTTIFPVCLTLPESADAAAQVRSIQQQLSAIPGHGSGFSALGLKHDAAVIFNYLGRMDSVTDGSGLFSFAPEPTGPWHSQSAERKYQIEINAMVTGGELETAWTAGSSLHSQETIQALADGFQAALREIILQSGSSAPAPDASLSGLEESALARLTRGQSDIVEVSALSPMQQLFYSASLTKPNAGYDQWHCHLHGPLNTGLLQQAWSTVLDRHSILRSSFHSAGLPHPVMIVRKNAAPEWIVADAIGSDPESFAARILSEDAAVRNDLTRPMLSRFTLVRFSETHHFMLWSLPDLHLDGWSWPIVFSEVNAAYSALSSGSTPALPEALPYRDWLSWLNGRAEEPSLEFWQSHLAGVKAPTPLPVDLIPGPKAARRFSEVSQKVDGAAVSAAARALSLSPGTFIQTAWALLLSRGSGHSEVVFGSAFSGRPAELSGADRIVGPFVNNLPVRLGVEPAQPAAALLKALQASLFDLSEHQYTPINRVQDCTEIPWQSRVFNSIAVFQNYEVDAAAKQFGEVTLAGFTGPIHTSYPLTLVVTPGDAWDVSLVYQDSWCSPQRAAVLLADFCSLLSNLALHPETTCAALMDGCSLPVGCAHAAAAAPVRRPGGTAPRTRMQKALADLWQRAFGLTDLTTEDNFFDLGGGSLLMIRLHAAIREELGRELPLVDLFRFPTIGALARHMDPAASTATSAVQVVDTTLSRAAAARAAASKLRNSRIRP